MTFVVKKPSIMLKNLSKKDLVVLGMTIKMGKTVDLFKSISSLTEHQVIAAMTPPDGEIYRKLNKNELKLLSYNFMTFENDISTDDIIDIKSEMGNSKNNIKKLGYNINQSDNSIKKLMRDNNQNSNNVKELTETINNKNTRHTTYIEKLQELIRKVSTDIFLMQEAMMGRIRLDVGSPIVEVSHTILNNAKEGEITEHLVGRLLHSITNTQYDWIRGEQARVNLTATIADENVPAPTATDPVEIKDGNLHSILTWGTGTGTYVSGVASSGSITCVDGYKLVDGETITIKDATKLEKIFEFDSDGTIIKSNIAVQFTAQSTASEIAKSLAEAIIFSGINITAEVNEEVLLLTQDFVGNTGNNIISSTVSDPEFIVEGFANGVADNIIVEISVESEQNAADNKLPFCNVEVLPVQIIFVVR